MYFSTRDYHCYCEDGYTGDYCQTDWDECWSDPCLNGATCIDQVADYNCTCPPGFRGKPRADIYDSTFSAIFHFEVDALLQFLNMTNDPIFVAVIREMHDESMKGKKGLSKASFQPSY